MIPEIEIAIIGGGIAGLSAAIACHQNNIDAHVYEAAPEFKPLGTSLSLWPNAMQCLSDWGLDGEVAARGAMVKQVAWRRPDGRAYFAHALDDLYADVGQSGYCVRRSDVHAILAAALPKERLHLGCNVTQSQIDTSGGHLTFENGQSVHAKHVIVADGLWSPLRNRLRQEKPPIYAGYGAWLGLSSAKGPGFAEGEAAEFLGHNGRFGLIETGQDTNYWFFVANRPSPTEHARVASVDEVMPMLSGWPDWTKELASAPADAPPVFVSFYDRPVSKSWGGEGYTLIGDAMHPFVPNLGQGACQAIEDGHAVAAALSKGLQGAALNAWLSNQRLDRLRYMRKHANKVGQLAQSTSPLARAVVSLFGMAPFQKMTERDMIKQFNRPAYNFA